ncbi:aminotransferase class V-fold PLP-dependent enzyme [Xenophilus arseniciresistens]|uniref:Aminotransferase class V-fold PLP-dependent enzyme n=1 Tax=Xenophilus arseniciresistens TaxID=1283306 RepID=A0AAE3N6X3_9BURK|nr:aminotransferase class V-fold PLP-dependent enzyme [Xenophilus arseniciresistens]MDA7417090.1 aminotransferase class V-fold PLP-dependent enzyme [Xenophilus arseniciresistens]
MMNEVESDFTTRMRDETPGVREVIHLNAAGAGLPPRAVTDTVLAQVKREAAVGPHWAAAEAQERLDAVRTAAAGLLGCEEYQIAFGPGAGRLWGMAMLSRPIPPSARILIARSEWVSNVLNVLRLQQALGVSVEVLPIDPDTGLIDVARAATMIDERTFALCVPVVSSGCGAVQPVQALGALPRPEHCLYFVDGTQAIGQRPVTLETTGADLLVCPGRKWLRGPKGEGMMALSERSLCLLGDPPLLDPTGSAWTQPAAYRTLEDARRFETYDYSLAGRLGLGAAIDTAQRLGVTNIRQAIALRLRQIEAGLRAVPGVTVFEDVAAEPSFLTYAAAGTEPAQLKAQLAHAGIVTATVGLDYARMDFEARGLTSVNRVAPHAYTTEAEADRFLAVVADAVHLAGTST